MESGGTLMILGFFIILLISFISLSFMFPATFIPLVIADVIITILLIIAAIKKPTNEQLTPEEQEEQDIEDMIMFDVLNNQHKRMQKQSKRQNKKH